MILEVFRIRKNVVTNIWKRRDPSYKDRSGSWRIDWTNKGWVIQMKPDCTGVEQHEDYMIFHAVRDTYSPIAVYKALVKMALSLLPYEKMPFFRYRSMAKGRKPFSFQI